MIAIARKGCKVGDMPVGIFCKSGIGIVGKSGAGEVEGAEAILEASRSAVSCSKRIILCAAEDAKSEGRSLTFSVSSGSLSGEGNAEF